MLIRKAIAVTGIVQGVGFRPFVYRLAAEHRLAGHIANTAWGVSIEAQGEREEVERFLERLRAEAPPLARITGIESREIGVNGETEFVILASRAGEEPRALISPDVAVCADCLRELFDPNDRRFHYPFINCTNCGPRFTIIRSIPYDRPRTSMAPFRMCAECQREYDDPTNRRFHAQPNACPACGPHVELWDAQGKRQDTADPIGMAIERLRRGEIVAVKGLGGFHLATDATNAAAVLRLRERKRRVEKPFAVMAPELETISGWCEVDDLSAELLLSPQRPIVLLPRKAACPVAEEVAPRQRTVGVFLPYTPLHHLLFARGGFPALVMTSGNLSEEPIAIDNREAVARLGNVADVFLVHNRDILLRCDDSVARVVAGAPRLLRRSRGYVPVPVFLRTEVPPILAVGGELKNTICLTKGRTAFLSQHVGDLENLESYRFFEEAIEHLSRVLEITPQIIAYDLHPDYFSTRWALEQKGVKRVGVQHHHAHIAACMAENHLEGRVIGMALDGTGYGTDGTIWGGEILVADAAEFERVAHLERAPMPGGEAAIREPWRMALSYLWTHFGRECLQRKIEFVRGLVAREAEVVLRMLERGVRSPLTSSCGRLFDAVAALCGVRQRVNYEAQAAMELEAAITGTGREEDAYPFELGDGPDGIEIGTKPLFEALLNDLEAGVPTGELSRRFHDGLAKALVKVAERVRERSGLNRVCLSGGTFQNAWLLEGVSRRLGERGFQVFTHKEVPAGDGGLALGQAMVAAARAS
jgi:hydrogenase maturation protein HypF